MFLFSLGLTTLLFLLKNKINMPAAGVFIQTSPSKAFALRLGGIAFKKNLHNTPPPPFFFLESWHSRKESTKTTPGMLCFHQRVNKVQLCVSKALFLLFMLLFG